MMQKKENKELKNVIKNQKIFMKSDFIEFLFHFFVFQIFFYHLLKFNFFTGFF